MEEDFNNLSIGDEAHTDRNTSNDITMNVCLRRGNIVDEIMDSVTLSPADIVSRAMSMEEGYVRLMYGDSFVPFSNASWTTTVREFHALADDCTILIESELQYRGIVD